MLQSPAQEKTQTVSRHVVRELIHELTYAPNDRRLLAAALAQEYPRLKPERMSYQESLEWADEDTIAA